MTTPDSIVTANPFAEKLRGFGPIGISGIVLIAGAAFLFVPLAAILVLAWRWRSNTSWEQIGYVAPGNWFNTIVAGALIGITFKLVMKATVMPMLGAPPINQSYHFLEHNPSALPYIFFIVIVSAGFGEETFYRSYLFERLGKLFDAGGIAKILIVMISSSLFAMAHYYDQGLPGVEQAAVTGLVFGTIYSIRKEIFIVMIAHISFDFTAVYLIYNGLENKIAHFLM